VLYATKSVGVAVGPAVGLVIVGNMDGAVDGGALVVDVDLSYLVGVVVVGLLLSIVGPFGYIVGGKVSGSRVVGNVVGDSDGTTELKGWVVGEEEEEVGLTLGWELGLIVGASDDASQEGRVSNYLFAAALGH